MPRVTPVAFFYPKIWAGNFSNNHRAGRFQESIKPLTKRLLHTTNMGEFSRLKRRVLFDSSLRVPL